MPWTEHVKGVLWTRPVAEEADELKKWTEDAGLIVKSQVVIAYKDHRYIMAQDPVSGGLVKVLVTVDGVYSFFRGKLAW